MILDTDLWPLVSDYEKMSIVLESYQDHLPIKSRAPTESSRISVPPNNMWKTSVASLLFFYNFHPFLVWNYKLPNSYSSLITVK